MARSIQSKDAAGTTAIPAAHSSSDSSHKLLAYGVTQRPVLIQWNRRNHDWISVIGSRASTTHRRVNSTRLALARLALTT